jgi:uncharacterized SAM-dependent methyltransferase
MLHFSNQELATAHHVSVRTVRNWIEAAKAGKLNLTLHTIGERTYIANTSRNTAVIQELVIKGKKYRPHRSQKVVSPKPEFYKIYSQEQIYDIVSRLDIYHEIQHQYNYFASGAMNWDEYNQQLYDDKAMNSVTATINLLESNKSYLEDMVSKYKYVNVIDIGEGNALPAKKLLRQLLDLGKLGRYVSLSTSASMLEIARRNVHEWFDDAVTFESHEIDINHDRFMHIIGKEYVKKEYDETVNILLLFGGTLGNLRSPEGALRVIHDSMGARDFLLYEKKLDSVTTRRFFDFNPESDNTTLAPIFGFVVDMLNIDRSCYEVELGYDVDRKERYERIKLKIDLTIKFEFDGGQRAIHLNKDETILVWRSRQQTALDVINQFDTNDFHPLHTSQTDDQEYIFVVSRIKRD